MVLIILKCIMFFLMLGCIYMCILSKTEKKEKISFKVSSYLKQFREGYFSYERIEKYLKSRGFDYITPAKYISIKFIVAAIFLILCELSGLYVIGIIVSITGFFLIDIIIAVKNKNDEEKIDAELGNVYSSLQIQMASGVFIGNALSDAYLVVKDKRLKEGLAIMSAEIKITKDIEKALDNFGERFISGSILNFVMVVKQSLETGQVEEEFQYMCEEMVEIKAIAAQEETKNIEDMATWIAFAIFLGVFFIAFYTSGSTLLNGWSSINM